MFVGCAPHILRPSLLAVLRPQDVFATTLYTGTGAARTLVTGIDLTGGGTFWAKDRSQGTNHMLTSAARAAGNYLFSNTTDAQSTATTVTNGFTTTGINIGTAGIVNTNGDSFVAWSFKKTSKFYTEVVYTGDATTSRQIAHDLGIAPGMIAIKRLDAASSWLVYHISLAQSNFLTLQTTDAASANANIFPTTSPTTTTFSIGNNVGVNASGGTYLARIWAHDPSASGVIQCGSVATAADGTFSVALPWAPQWLLFKSAGSADSWYIYDTARGATGGSGTKGLQAQSSAAEFSPSDLRLTSAGFDCLVSGNFAGSTAFVWMAIRSPT